MISTSTPLTKPAVYKSEAEIFHSSQETPGLSAVALCRSDLDGLWDSAFLGLRPTERFGNPRLVEWIRISLNPLGCLKIGHAQSRSEPARNQPPISYWTPLPGGSAIRGELISAVVSQPGLHEWSAA